MRVILEGLFFFFLVLFKKIICLLKKKKKKVKKEKKRKDIRKTSNIIQVNGGMRHRTPLVFSFCLF
jgi:hypothetical protein